MVDTPDPGILWTVVYTGKRVFGATSLGKGAKLTSRRGEVFELSLVRRMLRAVLGAPDGLLVEGPLWGRFGGPEESGGGRTGRRCSTRRNYGPRSSHESAKAHLRVLKFTNCQQPLL